MPSLPRPKKGEIPNPKSFVESRIKLERENGRDILRVRQAYGGSSPYFFKGVTKSGNIKLQETNSPYPNVMGILKKSIMGNYTIKVGKGTGIGFLDL